MDEVGESFGWTELLPNAVKKESLSRIHAEKNIQKCAFLLFGLRETV